jgi:hypothetical protein
MPKYDVYHEPVKRALIKDGWTITDDPIVPGFYRPERLAIIDAVDSIGTVPIGPSPCIFHCPLQSNIVIPQPPVWDAALHPVHQSSGAVTPAGETTVALTSRG